MEKLSKKFIAIVLVSMMILFTGIAGTFDKANALAGINLVVAEDPDKTEYIVGETLDTTGLLLNITFDDGSTTGVNIGYTCEPTLLTEEGKQEIKVSYSGLVTYFFVDVIAEAEESTTTDATSSTTTTNTNVSNTTPTTQLIPSTAAEEPAPSETSTESTTPTTAFTTTKAPATTYLCTTTVPATTKAPSATTTRVNHIYDINRNIVVNAKVQELSYGQGTYLSAEILPDNLRNYSIVWTSSDYSVASVDTKGHVVANGEGSVVITATVVDSRGYAVYDINGDEIKDTVVIKCTMTIWQKIVSFFRNLFSFLAF